MPAGETPSSSRLGLLTVLFTSAGRRVELLECFRDDARALGCGLRVLAVDAEPALSPACLHADEARAVPPIAGGGRYLEALEAICAAERVDLLVPLHDAELVILAGHADRFAARGTRVVVSSPGVVACARDKLATTRALARGGVPVPRTALAADVPEAAPGWPWPLIAKPVDGSGSRGVVVVPSPEALARLEVDRARTLVQELCPGVEYTVNVYLDASGRVRAAVPHRRLEVRAGEVSKGRTEAVPALVAIADRLGDVLPGARGPLCFQAIVSAEGRATVFEVNARFGGGFPLAHHAGMRVPRWLMEEALGLPCSAPASAAEAVGSWREGALMLRHDVSLFR